MSSRVIQALLGLSLLMNAFILAGFVYRSWIDPPSEWQGLPPPPPPRGAPGHPGQPGGPRLNPVEMVAQDLDLDGEQRKLMQTLFDQYAKARRDRLQDIQRFREQMSAELRKTSLDMAKVDALIDQVSRLRAEQQKETLRTLTQLDPALRPDQRERLQRLLVERIVPPPPPPPRPPAEGPPRPPR
ncbi:periplasmic heavy metal sensor [uncultured Reyranella sp.]|uniref:Spy/CpxP family protein refolding chaperone n=1 Tax=uncultured Reyranella sp. TaxID=735512 RepID=UPI00259C9BAE|nr:periplasmic heavy metal sensor [uncultured Reyranella sp.]